MSDDLITKARQVAVRLRGAAEFPTWDADQHSAEQTEAADLLDQLIERAEAVDKVLDESAAARKSGGVALGQAGRVRLLRSHLVIEANRLRRRAEKAEARLQAAERVVEAARPFAPSAGIEDEMTDDESALYHALAAYDKEQSP